MSFAYLPSVALLEYFWSVDADPWSLGTSSSDFIEDQICHSSTKVCRSRGKVQGQLDVLFYFWVQISGCRQVKWWSSFGFLHCVLGLLQRFGGTYCLHLQGDQIWFSWILKWLKDRATNQPTNRLTDRPKINKVEAHANLCPFAWLAISTHETLCWAMAWNHCNYNGLCLC